MLPVGVPGVAVGRAAAGRPAVDPADRPARPGLLPPPADHLLARPLHQPAATPGPRACSLRNRCVPSVPAARSTPSALRHFRAVCDLTPNQCMTAWADSRRTALARSPYRGMAR